ncbi:MAG: alpha/beta fold hydrolase [Bacteroidota bacterium]
MKNLLTLLILTLSAGASFGQFDDKFYFPEKKWEAIKNLDYTEVTIPVEAEKLNGIFVKPAGTPKATIFYLHGGGGNVSTYVDLVRPLVKDGFQVFMIDFRGYGKSTGKPNHLNVGSDGQVVFDWLLKRKEVQLQPIILYGVSLGTPIATKLAHDNTPKVAALVLDGTISSFGELAAFYVPEEQKAMVSQFVTSPYMAKEDIKTVKIPKLFIATKTDKVVPYGQTEIVYDNAPQPKELLIFEGEHIRSMMVQPEKTVEAVNRLLTNN